MLTGPLPIVEAGDAVGAGEVIPDGGGCVLAPGPLVAAPFDGRLTGAV
jgi:hypothetical protein